MRDLLAKSIGMGSLFMFKDILESDSHRCQVIRCTNYCDHSFERKKSNRRRC